MSSPPTMAAPAFQSPQNRGYSSDLLLFLLVGCSNLVSIPSESGLFLRFFGFSCVSQVDEKGFNPLRIGAIPQIYVFRSRESTVELSVSIPSESGLFLRSCPWQCATKSPNRFQSPQNRGYSSDVSSHGIAVRLPTCFNPLRIGAIPQIIYLKNTYGLLGKVSIPSESGLFLRCCPASPPRPLPPVSIPSESGLFLRFNWYSDDYLPTMSVSIPSESGLFLRCQWQKIKAEWDAGFNPLRIGAIPQMVC